MNVERDVRRPHPLPMPSFSILDRAIGPAHPPYVIAEIGVNHDGDPSRAEELVDAAVAARADAVKLQLFRADLLLGRTSELAAYQRGTADSATELLTTLELSATTLADVARRARERGLHAILTVFSPSLVERDLASSWDAFKIASPDLVNRPLLAALRATDRPLILSTGAATLDEVERTSRWLGDRSCAFLQCVSAYPTPDARAALGGIDALSRLTGRPVGYSDHTTATDTGGLAVAAGAVLLEKHLTHDRAAPGPDHACSLEPDAFAEYVRLAHRAWSMLGPREKRLLDEEQDVRRVSRQSIVTTRPLTAGATIEPSDLDVRRPGTGIEPWRLEEIVGRRPRHDLPAGAPIRDEDLA